MNPRQFAQFLGFYFYVLNVNAANDAQRVILLSSLIQIRALQAQLLLWNQRRRRRRGRRFPSWGSGVSGGVGARGSGAVPEQPACAGWRG